MAIRIALAGNPNCGKTTMFNDLTGNRQYVGNWPGVTVEKKEGVLRGNEDIIIQDLPGIYSLSPYTMEEVVTRDYLIAEHPDVILNIVDASNIERNLYLTTQLIEIGRPVVVALNMIDLVRKNGDSIDLGKLSKALECEVIETSALKGEGSRVAAELAAEKAKQPISHEYPHVFSGEVEHALAHIEDAIHEHVERDHRRFYTIKLFERDPKVQKQLDLPRQVLERIEEVVRECEKALDDDAESIITNARYEYITRLVQSCVTRKRKPGELSASDRIDRVLTGKWLALPVFALIMIGVYYVSVTSVGAIVTEFTNETLFGEWIMGPLGAWLTQIGTASWLTSLIVEGVVGGVGAVLGFVPQMFILFFFLAVLEDCGYMSRIAFIMDRLFRRFGLSGKSFIPMLIGSGCGVPGIMASRTIENERDRRMTIITTTFIPCGAKMPIVALIAGAVFGGAWWVAPSAYFLGVVAVVCSGLILKKTRMFTGDVSPFVMELPAYHWPAPGNVLRSVWERGWSFVKKAGTIILIASIVIWLLSNLGFADGRFGIVEDMDQSVLALLGGLIAPVFRPLGFGAWQCATATLMGIVAKEGVVSTFGVLFGATGDAMNLIGSGVFGEATGAFAALGAYSFLAFNLLCAPCLAAIGAIRREMRSGRWTWFAILYQCGLAYVASLIIYQFGRVFMGSFGVGTVFAILAFAGVIYMLLRPTPKHPVPQKS